MPNKNEREWLDKYLVRYIDSKSQEFVVREKDLPRLIAEAEKRERARVLEEIRDKMPPFLDVEPAGLEPPTDPMLAADQVRNYTLKQMHKILSSLSNPEESER